MEFTNKDFEQSQEEQECIYGNREVDIYGEVIDESLYHKSNAVGSTMLSTIIENPIKFKMIRDGKLKLESQAFENGTILHTKVLLPEQCDEVFIVSDEKISRVANKIFKNDLKYITIPEEYLTPSGSVSKKKDIFVQYEEWKEENSEFEIVSAKDEESLKFLQDNKNKIIIDSERESRLEVAVTNAENHLPYYERFFMGSDGYSERSFFAILYLDDEKEDISLTFAEAQELKEDDERLINGVLCQCRPDRIYVPDIENPRDIVVIDYKTTGKSATSEDWIKSSASFGYDLQEVHYRRVLVANGFHIIKFHFAYCSLLEYGGAGYKEHIKEDRDNAEYIHNKALEKLYYCTSNNDYSIQTFNGSGFDAIDSPALPIWRRHMTV